MRILLGEAWRGLRSEPAAAVLSVIVVGLALYIPSGLYLASRAAAGGEAIAFEDAWMLYRVHAAYCAPAACPLVLFPDYDTPAAARLAEGFLGRAQRALEDLDARGALRDFAGI